MSPKSTSRRSNERPHSSYNDGSQTAYYGGGIEIQCHFCPGQGFRRSRLRMKDLQDLFLLRYPVRCLRCGQRQTASFAVASVSVPSHIKQRRHRRSAERFADSLQDELPMSHAGSSAAEESNAAEATRHDGQIAS